MKTGYLKGAGIAVLLCGLTACAEDKGGEDAVRVVKLPVTGLMAGCCDSAVGKEFKAIPGVAGVSFEKQESGKLAVIELKKDAVLELSKVQEALATATKGMGKGMGTEYKLDTANVPVDSTVVFRTALVSEADKERLDKALAGHKGLELKFVESPDKESSAITPVIEEGLKGTLDQVTQILKDAKIALKEVVFHGAAGDDDTHGSKGEGEGSGCCGDD